jgi:mannosyl-oligosaccharide alpha-1,2-mannosidase
VACFDGGSFILGGLALKEQKYVEFGLNLTNACHETYLATKTGIGPELFQWQDNNTPLTAPNNGGPPAEQAEFYKKAGFWVVNGQYVLRPEVIESYYYAYRATGDTKYQDWAWDAFLKINATCAIGSGYSAISSVDSEGGGGFYDSQESFWFAEVLKYSYLIQAEDSDFQVKFDDNKVVYNTEAHPFLVANGQGISW